MVRLFPEPKNYIEKEGFTSEFKSLNFKFSETAGGFTGEELKELLEYRLYDKQDIRLVSCEGYELQAIPTLEGVESAKPEMLKSQGYRLEIAKDKTTIFFESKHGFINGVTSFKKLILKKGASYILPLCDITDYPSIPVRAVAPPMSWYAGYGRIGFDTQLFGRDKWFEYLNACVDDKINQLNIVMYGYWPFEFDEYPETVFRNIPVKIWNSENEQFLTINYTHPNLLENFLEEFIEYAHKLQVKIIAYVGLNSYNGGYSLKHPEKRMVAPKGEDFLNDFDSICLSDEENINYILASMRKIASLGFDGFSLEESEEGFWYCECEGCRARWHADSETPGEAKHKANFWLLHQIYDEVRKVNPEIIIGIRAFRQPPLEKTPEFLKECVDSVPSDVNLFWAPALYVPPTEFKKWVEAFGKERIWGRDSESNSITSTMGRLYRIFESNMIRYSDEPNVQVLERDIEQHITSVEADVYGINGFMFEWYGYFMHQWAHGNYGWGSRMAPDEFFQRSCEANFGKELGAKVLYVLQHIVTVHESQIPLYTTPFPFQKNKMTDDDIPAIRKAIEDHPKIMEMLSEIFQACEAPELRKYIPHFRKIETAERRNRVIYDLVLASLDYERETDPVRKDALLDVVLELNEKDFNIVRESYFDIFPVSESGVGSCMFPYHEMKRLIHNIRHPEQPDNNIVCSGIEALGWLWL